MTVLLAYVRLSENEDPGLAVVADDEGADYLFPDDVEPWLTADRIQRIVAVWQQPPTDAQGWLEAATYNLGLEAVVDPPIEVADTEEAVTQADEVLANWSPRPSSDEVLTSASESFDQVSADYPGFMENDDDDTSPEAMENFVLMMLGPIDPEGPNGWILRAQDGNPRPGDENEYVHMPGERVPAPDAAPTPPEVEQ